MSLQFSDTSVEKAGLIQDCEVKVFGNGSYGTISSNADLLAQFTQKLNRGLDKATTLILSADGEAQFDDSNNTTYPIGKIDLVSGQQSYPLSVSHLRILKVIVFSSGGSKTILKTRDIQDADTESFITSSTSGVPCYYDKAYEALWLDPIPNYNYTEGLWVYFQREPNYFITTDTSKKPGFNSLFHELVSLYAVSDYSVDMKVRYASDVAKMEEQLKDFYSNRTKDKRRGMRPLIENTR